MSIRIKIPLLIAGALLINAAAFMVFLIVYLPGRLLAFMERTTGVAVSAEVFRNNNLIPSIIFLEMIAVLLFAVISAVIAYRYYARPLAGLAENVSDPKTMHAVTKTARRDEIGQLQNSFERLSAQLQEEKINQDRIIAGISHDIKTPLTSIAGYSETLQKKELTKEQSHKYLTAIFSNAQRIEQILEEFDLYVESRMMNTVEKKAYPAAFVAEILLEEYYQEMQSQQIAFHVRNNCPAGTKIFCDLAKIRRVFANLISNAIKHNPETKDFSVSILLAAEKADFIVVVKDNGKGVNEHSLPHIFEPFYTSNADRSRHGLGLSVCRDIVHAHGGSIKAVNLPEGGFEIKFTLPREKNFF